MSSFIQKELQTVEADQWDGSPEHAITIIEWVKTIVPNALITYDDYGLTMPPRNAPVIRAQTKFGQEAVQEDGWIAIDAENNLRVYTTEQFDAIFEGRVMITNRPPEAYDFTVEEVALYLGVTVDEHLHNLGMLETCIAVIARYEPDHLDYRGDIVEAAARSLFQWMSDYEIEVERYSIPCPDQPVAQVRQVFRRARPQVRNGFAAWTPELEQELISEAIAGSSTEDLAVQFGRSVRAIEQRLILLGLRKRYPNSQWSPAPATMEA